MTSPRIRSRLAPTAAIAVLASMLVVAPAAAAEESCTHVGVRLTEWPTEDPSGQTYLDDQPIFYWGAEGAGSTFFTLQVFGHYCGPDTTIQLAWTTDNGTAVAGSDYTDKDGTFTVTGSDTEWDSHTVSVPIIDDASIEPAAEYFIARISGGHAQIYDPRQAPVFIVDNDGTHRVTLPPDPYDAVSMSELHAGFSTGPDVQLPVFRAGPATADIVVPYTVTPGSGVTDGDYNDLTNGQVMIPAGQRMALIKLEIIDDLVDEADETLTIDITPPGGVGGETTQSTVTIIDNDVPGGDQTAPETSFHHPKHNKVYKPGNILARTIHVFAPGTSLEPSGIDWVQTALRRKKTNGSCQWLTKTGNWVKDPCKNAGLHQHWLPTWFFDTWNNKLIYEYPKSPGVMDPLKPSKGTNIKNYFVYSRAKDKAGNVENTFELGRNKNRFEIKK